MTERKTIISKDFTVGDGYTFCESYTLMTQDLAGEHCIIVINPIQARELFNFLKEKYNL